MSDGDQCSESSDCALNVRSYAPFASFGGGFEGDNRAATTARNATSRIAVQILFNPVSGKIGKPSASSSGTTFLPLGTKGMAEPRTSLSRAQRIPSGFVISMDIAGANPLVPGAPDIDLHTMIKITCGAGGLHVSGSLRGDAFPNAEIFLSDDVGTSRMLMTFATTGGPNAGPFFKLPGDTKRWMNGICYTFPIDARGRFR